MLTQQMREHLAALRDVIERPELQQEFRKEEGWGTSLFRDDDNPAAFLVDAAAMLSGDYSQLAELSIEMVTLLVRLWLTITPPCLTLDSPQRRRRAGSAMRALLPRWAVGSLRVQALRVKSVKSSNHGRIRRRAGRLARRRLAHRPGQQIGTRVRIRRSIASIRSTISGPFNWKIWWRPVFVENTIPAFSRTWRWREMTDRSCLKPAAIVWISASPWRTRARTNCTRTGSQSALKNAVSSTSIQALAASVRRTWSCVMSRNLGALVHMSTVVALIMCIAMHI